MHFDDNMEIGARGSFITTSDSDDNSHLRHSIVLRSGDNSHEIRLTFNDETRVTKASYFYVTKVLCRSDTEKARQIENRDENALIELTHKLVVNCLK